MSTFLTLVQDLHREVGAAGTAPSTVANQRGEALRLLNYIKEADSEIQELWMNWKFLFANPSFSQTATTSVAAMSAPAGIGMWDLSTFKLLPVGETLPQQFPAYEYEDVKTEILDPTPGLPWRVIVMPDNSLKLDSVPNNSHTVLADYFKAPVALAANGDISLIPERYHGAILGAAIKKYGEFEGAAEMMTKGQNMYDAYYDKLETHQLPNRNYARRRTGAYFEVIGSQNHDGWSSGVGSRNGY